MDDLAEMAEEPLVMHGRLGTVAGCEWQPPLCVQKFDAQARYSFTDIKAHEWQDQPDTLRSKVRELAAMVRGSRFCLAYTGAGISTAAGIDDYATKGGESSVTAKGRSLGLKDWKEAKPTTAHYVLAAMHDAGLLHCWIQQNHDSLPQKAGFPQTHLNEIHGSLHDPANPIVPYEGTLRDDLYEWMQRSAEQADLCLALGSSLSGFNADQVAQCAADRSCLVIVNLQQTPYDGDSKLRIFAKLDTVFEMLARELGIQERVQCTPHQFVVPADAKNGEDRYLLPFDGSSGDALTATGSDSYCEWDLRPGKLVRVTGGPYSGDIGRVIEKNHLGDYRIRFEESMHETFGKRRPFSLWLGHWWPMTAANGGAIVPDGRIPVVNLSEQETEEYEHMLSSRAAPPAVLVPTRLAKPNTEAPPAPPLPPSR